MDEGLVKIILAVITLLGTIITVVVVPFINAKKKNYIENTTEEKRKQHLAIIRTAVFAVEQMMDAGLLNIPKKDAVVEYIRGLGLDLTEKDLDMFIEAMVKELNLEQQRVKG